MNKNLLKVVGLLCVLLLTCAAFAQETTAGIQGTIKDPQGAVVSGATVEVTSPALIGVKKLETDTGGYYRFANLPPGTYTITVTKAGFRTLKQDGVRLAVGSLPSIDLKMEVGGVEQTIEVSSAAPIVDVTTSKVQTNVTSEVLAAVPKGRSFQSVIQFAPGSRSEPLQGGYQIDGASNSENSYLVEGQETASVFNGASNTNVPMEFIQEVQVKSSGFEAEYGGALGGVVNVIQKRGGNAWHGSVFMYYSGDKWDAAPNRSLRRDPFGSTNVNGPREDQPYQYYQPKKDHYRTITPGIEAGGYLMKDRLWLFLSTAPEYFNLKRTVNFVEGAPVTGQRSFEETINTYYSMARLDYLVSQKIRVYGAWQYSYQRQSGNSLPGADDVYGLYNTSSQNNVDSYNRSLGAVYPNVIYNTGADITLTPNIVATTRYGYFYTDSQSRGLPIGDRFIYTDTNYPYSTGNIPSLTGFTALDGAPLPSSYQHTAAWANIGANYATVFDQFKRYSFSQDLAYFKKGFGTHNFKFGYALNHNTNDILNGYNTAAIYVAYGVAYGPWTTTGINRCLTINAQNLTNYGNIGEDFGADPTGAACTGAFGTVNFRDLATTGKVGNYNHALYVQDAWTLGKGVTLNIGARWDKEDLPSYNPAFQGISFGWADKFAPRLGGSWDVFQNGKFKVYGSFGYFYDIMKFQLPRGSFGGDFWHDCVYAMDSYDFTQFKPARDANGHYCPLDGNSGVQGTIPSTLRFIENVDYRQPSNDPDVVGALGPSGLVDPKLKPMKQHEMVFGADWALSPTLAFETRYSRKRLDRTIEDAGIMTPYGEQYYIVNPGEFFNATVPPQECTTCVANPKATRKYDGVEFRLTKRPTGKWFGSVSYTYSRLYGNYSGLTATDISDGGGARQGANTDRAFDEAWMQFDAHGRAIDGPLATDRPSTFKAIGYYRLKYGRFETLLGGFQQWYSGTPLSSYVSVWGAPVFVEGRGKYVDLTRDNATGDWVNNGVSERRTPQYSQTDVSLVQEYKVSKNNENLRLGFEANITNLFNQHSVTYIQQNMIRTSGLNPWPCSTTEACPETNASGIDYAAVLSGYDYIAQANSQLRTVSGLYGLPYGWQSGRSMRFKIRFTF